MEIPVSFPTHEANLQWKKNEHLSPQNKVSVLAPGRNDEWTFKDAFKEVAQEKEES